MIVVADVNTIWRSRPFAAISAGGAVLGLEPMDPIAARRRGWPFALNKMSAEGQMLNMPVLMPFGWARNSTASCRRLLQVASRTSVALGKSIEAVVVTSPHYRAMPSVCGPSLQVYYYCSDDYSTYVGWGGQEMLDAERELVSCARHSFFVSRALADRAVREYGIPAVRVSVSPNATDLAFLATASASAKDLIERQNPRLRRPIVGVVGSINDRLDFGLLQQVVELPCVGSLLMVGGVDSGLKNPDWLLLSRHPKCVLVGPKPHVELPVWLQILDIALIPYRDTPLNRACSPMRLYDHLASGRPIVATKWCEQIQDFRQFAKIGGSTGEVVDLLADLLLSTVSEALVSAQRLVAQQNTWLNRAANLKSKMLIQ